MENRRSDFSVIGRLRLASSRIGCRRDSSREGTGEVLGRRPSIMTVDNICWLRQVDSLLCHDIVEGPLELFDIISICETSSVFFPGLL